jgi:pimeloyl-ACP methyl ester carboxylesterase
MKLSLAVAGLSLALVPLGSAARDAVTLKPCTVGGGVAARCGTYTVPEDRAAPEGRSIRLRIAVIPARAPDPEPDPLVYITGGPGSSAIADAAGFASSVFADVNATRDVVLVDQRGTGGSNRLLCPLPPKGVTLETAAQIRRFVRQCVAGLDADPRDYTTIPAMEDLAEVVGALGYGQVNLYGGSYGATAVQYFLAQHPELVRTAIMDGGTMLDVPIFEVWGRNGQRAMKQILARCATSGRCARAYPRVRRELFEALAALRRAPARIGRTTIDAPTAAEIFQLLSRTPDGAAQIPWVAHRASTGDWIPFDLARDSLTGSADSSSVRQVMPWSILCSEPWARMSPSRTAAASKGTYLAEWTAANTRRTAAVCSGFPKAPQPAWTRSRVQSDVPTLIVVGGTDPQDPLANVAHAQRELPNSRTVVVPGGGHGSIHLGCMPQVAARFVASGTVTGLGTRCVARYQPPRFVLPR